MRYKDYKKVNLLWLDEVPSHWEIKNVNSLFDERREKVSDKDYPPLSVTKNGVLPQLENVAKSMATDNRKKVLKGDFVINSRSDRKGSSGLSCYTGSVSLISTVIQPRLGFSKFWHYLLKSNDFIEEFYRNGKGIVADLWTTNFQSMKSIILPIPPKREQEQIARFLDWKIMGIDRIIEIKKKKIEKINEIWESVLRNNLSNKSNIIKLKFICEVIPGKEVKEEIDSNQNNAVAVYGSSNIPFKFTNNSLLDGKYIIIGRKGTIGKPYKLDGKFWIVDTAYAVKNKDNVIFDFLYFSLCVFNWSKYTTQTALPSIVANEIIEEKIYCPPIEIQNVIVEKLNMVQDKVNDYNINLQSQIKKLELLKQSLISDVVTGRFDVRNIPIPNFEEYEKEVIEDDEEILEEEEV